MTKRIMTIVLCVAMAFVTAAAFAADVYVTENGKKYHAEGCRFIANKATQKISEKEAKAQGLTACGKCLGQPEQVTKAPAENSDTVYATKSGKKYHRQSCSLIKNKETVALSLKEAQGKGLEPCGRCFRQEAKLEK